MNNKKAFDRFLNHHNIYNEFYDLFNSQQSQEWRRMHYQIPVGVSYFEFRPDRNYISSAFSWASNSRTRNWARVSTDWITALSDKRMFFKNDQLNPNIKIL